MGNTANALEATDAQAKAEKIYLHVERQKQSKNSNSDLVA
jgi:hypothetical protein